METSQEKDKGFAGKFYLESLNPEQAVKRDPEERRLILQKKVVLGVQTWRRKARALGGAGKARNNAYFGVLQIKGELKRLWAPGRCQGAAVGTGGREGCLGHRSRVPQGPSPALGGA